MELTRAFAGHAWTIKPDARWEKSGWDLAVDFPTTTHFWQTVPGKGRRFIGQSLRSLARPATWATKKVEGKVGKPTYYLTAPFRDEWFHVAEPKCFIHRANPNRIMNQAVFDATIQPYCDKGSGVAALLGADGLNLADVLIYDPALPNGLISGDNLWSFNTFVGSDIEPAEGSAALAEEFFENLFPVKEDRTMALKWCATLVCDPEIRMLYGVLLMSILQGVGKTTLAQSILRPLIGSWNVSFPTEQTICKSEFNGWKAHKRLAIVNEIYQGE